MRIIRKMGNIGDMEMTTIIVVAIVALVFFVTICVVAFMVWKHETEKHTDSLRGIEDSLHDVLHEIYGGAGNRAFIQEDVYGDYEAARPTYKYGGSKIKKDREQHEKNKKRDPFRWMRSEDTDDDVIIFKPDKKHVSKLRWKEITEQDIGADVETLNEEVLLDDSNVNEPNESDAYQERHIDLSMIDILEDMEFFEELQEKHTDYNVGKSGKKYTAEELEELIKE